MNAAKMKYVEFEVTEREQKDLIQRAKRCGLSLNDFICEKLKAFVNQA